jgi:tRNA 5-methylaminomethyl-2-thiouridine biosynthesis bifunctional protein
MLAHLRKVLPLAPQFAQAVSADDIAERIGIAPRCGGIHYQRGGWLDPRAVCRALLDHPLIRFHENCGPLTLLRTDNGHWQALNKANTALAEAPAAILATAHGVLAAPQLAWLPITPIRGQTTHLASTTQLSGLDIALCDQGYLPPAREGLHCIGASFGPGDVGTDEREPEHAHNVGMMQSALPQLDIAAPEHGWQGHVAHRCNSNDYLPIAGMAPNLPAFNAQYDRLRHDRKQLIDAPAPLHAGLGVLTSLGSRGLTAAPLAAEVLADQLLGGIPCVPRYLQRAISPARFAERALKRGQAL